MARSESSRASINVYGDDLDLAEITRRLGGEPTHGVARGDVRRTVSGREKIARTGMWLLEPVECEP